MAPFNRIQGVYVSENSFPHPKIYTIFLYASARLWYLYYQIQLGALTSAAMHGLVCSDCSNLVWVIVWH